MTVTDRVRFQQAFNRLAVATRLPADQVDAVMHKIYWDGLEDLPVEAVEDAAKSLARADWFPKLGEWRSIAEKAREARILTRALPQPREEPWRFECGTCDDTGWEPLTCPGNGSCNLKQFKFCEQRGVAHPYVVVCPCRLTNRTYQRKQAEARQRQRGATGGHE